MSFREERVVYYLDTIWAIAASEYVNMYVVGFTSGTAYKRFAGYKLHGYHHIVTLENNLSFEEAGWLEKELQARIKGGDKRSTNYRKYHQDKRDLGYSPNYGRTSADRSQPVFSVYMAWVGKDIKRS